MKRIALSTGLLLMILLASFVMMRARAQDEPAKPILADDPPVPTLPDQLQPPSPDAFDPVSPAEPLPIDPQPVVTPQPAVLPLPLLPDVDPPALLDGADPFSRPSPAGTPIPTPSADAAPPSLLSPPLAPPQASSDLFTESNPVPPRSDPYSQAAQTLRIVSLRTVQANEAVSTLRQLFKDDNPAIVVADERSNSVILRGQEEDLQELIALLEQLDSAEFPEPKRALSRRLRSDDEVRLEKQALNLKAQLNEEAARSADRKPADSDARVKDLIQQIRSAVDESFNERQRQQLAEIEELTVRLNKLAKAVREREEKREAIIEQRISELTRGGQQTVSSEQVDGFHKSRSQEFAASTFPIDEPSGESLLFFTAAYCQPCQKMESIITTLESEGVQVRRVDITIEPETTQAFAIDRIPTMIVRSHGKTVETFVGITDESKLLEAIGRAKALAGQQPRKDDFIPDQKSDERVQFIEADPNFTPDKTIAGDSELVKLARSLTAAADAVRFYKSNLAELEKAGVSSPNDSINLSSARRRVTSGTGIYQQTLENCLTHRKLLTIELKRAENHLEAAKLRAQSMHDTNARSSGAYHQSEIRQAELRVADPQAEVDRLRVLMDLFQNIEQEATPSETEPLAAESKIDDLAPDGKSNGF